jgi:acetyltransferase
VSTLEEALMVNEKMSFPLVMKVVGPVHKSDVGGVQLNVKSNEEIKLHYERMMQIEGSIGVLFQPMSSGLELFAGIKKEGDFGHLIMCGLGGIFIEVLKDVSIGLVPLNRDESLKMIKSLRGYKLIEGVRGQSGVDENVFANILVQLSVLIEFAPEIIELDLNPLLGDGDRIIAVDARIRIEK